MRRRRGGASPRPDPQQGGHHSNPGARWSRLPAQARETIVLRRAVRELGRESTLRTAHPEVARRLSDDLGKSLGREVRVPARRIVQVVWGFAEHQALRKLLGSTVGIGIYPSKTWGHGKLRLGDLVSDASPRRSGTLPLHGQPERGWSHGWHRHSRYYEAVFAADPTALQSTLAKAEGLVAEKRDSGDGLRRFVSKLLREHLADATKAGASRRASSVFSGKARSAAGTLWKKAASSSPALIIVYTPPGDYRSVTSPALRFDFSLR